MKYTCRCSDEKHDNKIVHVVIRLQLQQVSTQNSKEEDVVKWGNRDAAGVHRRRGEQ